MFVALLVSSLLGVAAAPVGQDKGKKDEEKIVSTWSAVSAEKEGMKAPDELVKNLKVTFADGKVKVSGTGNDKVTDISYTLDPTTKPKEINFTEGGIVAAKGIYELNGDVLKICFDDTAVRPTDFTTQAGSSRKLFVLKRDKE
jgi:uncharacterized protein (TIGR03067 family)